MSALMIIFISMTLAIAVFSAGLSLQSKRRDQGVFLAVFFGLYAFIKLDDLFLFLEGYALFPHFLGIAFPAKLLLGPSIYFYTRALISPDAKWASRRDWPAVVAPALAFLVAIPFYILPANDKVSLMSPETRDPDLYATALLGCKIGFGLFVISSLSYLYATHRLFRNHDKRLRDLFSRIDDKTVDWLRWIILILAVGWSGYAISELWAIQGGRPIGVLLFYLLFELLWISVIAFCGVTQRPVAVAPVAKTASSTPKPSLSEARIATVASRLDQVISQQRLFENPNLSLRDLSDAIGVTENHLSETFSRHYRRNFYDYVNGYRVSQACQLLENTDQNILEIAIETGFNSRSTFNAAFKKHVGATPSQFRRALRAAESGKRPVDRTALAD